MTDATDESAFELLPQLPSLRCLVVQSGRLSVGAAHLPRIKALESLVLDGLEIDLSVVDSIVQCRALKALSLNESTLNDDHLIKLAEMSWLEDLSIGSTRVTEVGLRSLPRFSSLGSLDISYLHLECNGVQLLLSAPKLSAVVISDEDVENCKDIWSVMSKGGIKVSIP